MGGEDVRRVPRGQAVQVVRSSLEMEPAGQRLQATVPGRGAWKPSAHCRHSLYIVTSEKVPGAQGEQAAPPASAVVPFLRSKKGGHSGRRVFVDD